MQINWVLLLTKLGCYIDDPTAELHNCPLHPGMGKTLKIIPGIQDQNKLIFNCVESHCNFYGDALMLVSRVRGVSLTDAARLFQKDQEFADVLDKDNGTEQLNEYLHSNNEQIRLLAYLGRTQSAIRNTFNGEKLRNKMAKHGAVIYGSSTLQDIPNTLGLLIADGIPTTISKARAYTKEQYAIYPYTYNNEITAIRIQNFDDTLLTSITLPIACKPLGVFMEDNLAEVNKTLIVAPNEITACQLNRRYSNISTKRPPVICALGFPLPATRLQRLKRIILASYIDTPLPLETALRVFNTEELVEGRKNIPILVAHKNSAETMPLVFADHTELSGIMLKTWIVNELDKLIKLQNREVIYQAFKASAIPESKKAELIAHVKALNLPEEIITTIGNTAVEDSSILRLANGKEIRQTPYSFLALSNSGEDKLLSNIHITVTECVFNSSGQIKYNCKLRAKADSATISTQLADRDFVKAPVLQKKIQQVFLEHEEAIYPAIYAISGYKWSDIIAKLAEGKPVKREVEYLGNVRNNIHFPNFYIDLNAHAIHPQQQLANMTEPVIQMYSGLTFDTAILDYKTAIYKLIQAAKTNTYYAGYLAMLCHMLYLLRVGKVRANRHEHRSAIHTYPRHLLLVETTPNVWGPLYCQFAQLFSATNETPRFTTASLRKNYIAMNQLGTLPCIRTLPIAETSKIAKFLANTPLSVISPITQDAAIELTGESRITFIESPVRADNRYALADSDLIQIQASLPGLLLALISQEISTEERKTLLYAETPALVAYNILCQYMQLDPNEEFAQSIKHYYTASGISCIYQFLREIGNIKEEHKSAFNIVYRQPQPDDAEMPYPPDVYLDNDCLYISKQLILCIPEYSKASVNFNISSLNMDFERLGHTREPTPGVRIDRNRYWILDKQLWYKYIIRNPIMLQEPVTSGNVIQLPRMLG